MQDYYFIFSIYFLGGRGEVVWGAVHILSATFWHNIQQQIFASERLVQTKYAACLECQANKVGIVIASLFPPWALLCHNPPPLQ